MIVRTMPVQEVMLLMSMVAVIVTMARRLFRPDANVVVTTTIIAKTIMSNDTNKKKN